MAKAKKEPNWQENELPSKRMFDQMDKMRKENAPKKQPKSFMDSDVDGMKKGGGVKKYQHGGGIESKGKTQGKIVKMARGGGVESKGKTRGKFV